MTTGVIQRLKLGKHLDDSSSVVGLLFHWVPTQPQHLQQRYIHQQVLNYREVWEANEDRAAVLESIK